MRTAAVVLTLALAGSARADEATPTIDELFDQGRALLADHHPVEACARFEGALKLDADAAGVMLNLGLCNEEQDKTATALKWFRKAQARGSEMKLVETEAAAKEHGALLAAKVPTVKLAFRTRPRIAATVTLDGDRVEDTTFARVELDPGHHEVVVTTLEGKTSQAFDILDGQARVLALDLPTPPAPQTRVEAVDARKVRRKHALEIGAASAGLGVLVLGWATYEKIHTDRQGLSPSAYVDAKNNLGLYGTIAGSVSAAGLGLATYVYLTAPDRPRREQIVPVASPTEVGLSYTRGF